MRWSLYAQHEFAESNIRTIMKNVIKECLNKEAQALRSLIDTVDDEYVKIVTLFAHCEGKLVITGVGKSLLVGKKIAASFVSLGIKAIALSPLSMMHGDIGLLDKKDILVCFSKSGETKILCNIIEWVKMHIKIPVVSILGTALSTIYKESNHCIVIDCEEADPFNIVPTTSTTAMMAIGDALLCAVVKLKGITLDELKKNHPGGSIGEKMNCL